MKKKKEKFYITTSIAYTNSTPHIGFALEAIQADVIARYQRFLGKEVFFLTGTDEHGSKIERAAKKAGKSPKKFTDEISSQFKKLKEALNLSNDDFIRTTDKKRHWPSVKKVWLELRKKGDIYKKKYKGFYCVGCEAFITRKDLKDGKCAVHKKKPEVLEEENYFFKLSKYQDKIEDAIKKDKIKIIPRTRKNEILSFIKEGIDDVSFSRSRKNLKWGIPVSDDKTQTIYVWSDALVNYISALDYAKGSKKFKDFWPADIHCIGKDIIRFHTIIWPGMLFSLGLVLPKNIFVHGFITSEGQKMSKSLGNVINPFELVEKYGIDPVRYFLLREIPSTGDGDFSYEKFEARYNADLAGGVGNLVARVIAMAEKVNSKSGAPNSRQISSSKFQTIISKTQKNYKRALDEFKFNEALISIWDLIAFCDKYIEEERPWEKSKNQLKTINNLLSALGNIALLLQPFLPGTSEKIFKQLGVKLGNKGQLSFNIKKAKPIFPKYK
ncbi:methionine--tRNA ligase [Patescibacteria group bacterium]